jgi:hypothetical protein
VLARHEAIVLLQAGGYVSLSGFATVIAACWYALARLTLGTTSAVPTVTVPTTGES